MNHYDVIVVGAGIAGLHAALRLPKSMNVLVVSKDYPWECNTFYAQGGVAVANSKEDIPLHIADTIEAGCHHGDLKAIETLCKEGPIWVQKLIEDGFEFDKDKDGQLNYTKEAAHSSNRILHADGDATGRALHVHLMKHLHAHLLYNTQVVDVSFKDSHVNGVCLFHKNQTRWVGANHVILASGGVGSLYSTHTNARTISADLQGIALESGLKLKDMEMMQFHPTVYIEGKGVRKQLLSEALRGEGAKVVDEAGERFLFQFHPDGELAPRNVVSQSIFEYCQDNDTRAYLDVGSWSEDEFAKRFPSIHFAMRNVGIKVPSERIPISPAFHYAMGGISTDLDGLVYGTKNLYAVGEVAHTGVHGANRLASNSLLEGLVFSARASKVIASKSQNIPIQSKFKDPGVLRYDNEKPLKDRLRNLMWRDAGIVRNTKGLAEALNQVEDMLKCRTGKLLRLRLLASREILTQALSRSESLGAHQLVAHPINSEGKI